MIPRTLACFLLVFSLNTALQSQSKSETPVKTTVCQLKSDPATSQMKIILMSGIEADNANLQSIGADDFIPKPFDYDDLLERVSRQMSGVAA